MSPERWDRELAMFSMLQHAKLHDPGLSLHLSASMAPLVVPIESKICNLEHHAHKFPIWGRQKDVRTNLGTVGRRKNGLQGHPGAPYDFAFILNDSDFLCQYHLNVV
jgi:hypothetical protein